jgi:short-subunit dehydrogenase
LFRFLYEAPTRDAVSFRETGKRCDTRGMPVGMSRLEGKVVAITGASAGVGRATVREVARQGADVGLIARGEERLNAAAAEVREHGRRACVAPADVADAEQVEAAAARIEAELGPIDVWINVAMTAVLAEVMETTPEEFLRVTQVTYLGSVHGTQAALRRMVPRDRGVIVQVGSALSRRGIPLQATYCGAKHAIKGFLDSLRAELIHHGSNVRVALVQLPGLNTPQFSWVRTRLRKHPQPVPPIYQPEVAARAIASAAAHPRRELWVGLPTVYTILGEKVASGLMDRYLGRTNEQAQEADQPIDPSTRVDNLFAPPPGDPGAHGIFDASSKVRSPQLWLTLHKRALAAGVAGVALGAAVAVTRVS